MNLEFCDRCGEDFRYDDTGGYNPPCACKLNCRSCCEHGRCEREPRGALCECGDAWEDHDHDDEGLGRQCFECPCEQFRSAPRALRQQLSELREDSKEK